MPSLHSCLASVPSPFLLLCAHCGSAARTTSSSSSTVTWMVECVFFVLFRSFSFTRCARVYFGELVFSWIFFSLRFERAVGRGRNVRMAFFLLTFLFFTCIGIGVWCERFHELTNWARSILSRELARS